MLPASKSAKYRLVEAASTSAMAIEERDMNVPGLDLDVASRLLISETFDSAHSSG